MFNTRSLKLVIFAAAISVAWGIYLALSDAPKLVVDRSGQVSGYSNKARETLQGRAFWEGQRRYASVRLQRARQEPAREAETDRELGEMRRQAQEMQTQLYRERPELRPPASYRKAEALRDEADRVESEALSNQIAEDRSRQIVDLLGILALIDARLDQGAAK